MYQRVKPILRTSLAIVAIAAAASALAIWVLGGFKAGSLTATDPARPLALFFLTGLAWIALSGLHRARLDFHRHRHRLVRAIALTLAIAPALAGLARNSWTAGGADSYAYVSQADLWTHFSLKTPAPLGSVVPWPNPVWSFTPHGYRPAAADEAAIVPVTAPGLPIMMASAKVIAGHCAMFWVTPLTGALLVWMTFAIGKRVGSDGIGLAAAWLMATSPTFLAMLVSPMSDVPAAAFWAVAIYFAIGRSRQSGIACGLAASMAILIRPNLAPIAAAIVLWMFIRAIQERRTPQDAIAATLAIVPGCAAIAATNIFLYGSPISSGYGGVDALFSLSNIPTNFQRYGSWLLESQPFAILGLGALVFPSPWLWPKKDGRRMAMLLAAVVAIVWMLYLIYTPFDAWWYLRFLLPSWPGMCLGTATLLVRSMQRGYAVFRVAAVLLLTAAGLQGIWFAASHSAFPSGEGDHRYVSIAKLAEQFTDPSSVIIAGQNAGATRYYGGRQTLRFDYLDEAWLDRAVDWLQQHGHHPYFLLEEWEIPIFQKRFSANSPLGALTFAPIIAYHAPGVPGSAFLFDPFRRDASTLRPVPPPSARPRCVEPVPLVGG